MKTRLTLLITLSVVAAVATAACFRAARASNDAVAGEAGAPIEIIAVEVRMSNDGGALEIPASIESRRRAVLTSRLAASIVELSVREGDVVKGGTVLVRLEDKALQAALSAAEASDRAATRDLQRAEALLTARAATPIEVENAATARERTRSTVAAAREATSYAAIRAPFTGRVLRKLASTGDIVSPGQPLLEIEGTGKLEVVASIDGAVRDRLETGQNVEVVIDGADPHVAATLHELAASADPSTHRFTLRADIISPEGVHAGQFARVLLPSTDREARILIPSGAIFSRGGLTGVYVIRENRAWLRWIALGEVSGDFVESRAGLEVQERVALDPSRLHDGAPVSEGRR